MQFVFGDNTSKYTMLYSDDKPDAAEKAQRLVQMSYSPNPDFDSVGFVPFGTNNTRALFFKFCKDFKMKRNVYFLHGVYRDVDPEYFYGNNYVNGLFTEFLDQEKFDVLRDQVLAGEKCDVPYGYNKVLAATPYEQISVEPGDLHEILTKLYQRKEVVLVMDDDKFSEQRALLTIKLVFRYLTPSLRKLCSYVTAVDDTGDMNFMLRIIPRCMLKPKEEYVDLDNRNPLYKDKTNFSAIALALMTMDDRERQDVFDLYEKLYYGKDSIYKKQNFERFYMCYTSSDEDEETLRLCDELLTDYLDNPKRENNPEIPSFLRDALASRYASHEVLDKLVDWNPRKLENMSQFCDTNADVLRKVYYLADRNLTYFRDKISNLYCRTYLYNEMGQLEASYNSIQNTAHAMRDVEPCEDVLVNIVEDVLKILRNLLEYFKDFQKKVDKYATEYLQQNCKRGANEPRAVVEYAMSMVVDEMKRLSNAVTDVNESMRRHILEEIVMPHNTECKRVACEERYFRDKSMKSNIFTAFVYRLKLDIAEVVDTEDSDAPEYMPVDLDSLDIDPMGLSEEDLDRVAEDEELASQLAQEMADYVIKVCAKRERSDFNPFRNANLKLVKNLKLCFKVATLLCQNDASDLAVLYLLAYCPALDAALNFIMKMMPQMEVMSKQGLQNIKRIVPAQLKKRVKTDGLYREDIQSLDKKMQAVLDDKTLSKPRKAVANMVCDWANDRPPILVRERKRNMIVAAAAGVGVLLLGVLLVVILLGGDKGKDADPTDAPKTTQSTTAPTEPEVVPCQHEYKQTGFKPATCTTEGEKTMICKLCDDTKREVIAIGNNHTWEDGVCSICNRCETHNDESWNVATCTTPKTCKTCGLTEGEALGHDYQGDVCQRCKDGCDHSYSPVEDSDADDCSYSFECNQCEHTKIEVNHNWNEEDVCSKCGVTKSSEESAEE